MSLTSDFTTEQNLSTKVFPLKSLISDFLSPNVFFFFFLCKSPSSFSSFFFFFCLQLSQALSRLEIGPSQVSLSQTRLHCSGHTRSEESDPPSLCLATRSASTPVAVLRNHPRPPNDDTHPFPLLPVAPSGAGSGKKAPVKDRISNLPWRAMTAPGAEGCRSVTLVTVPLPDQWLPMGVCTGEGEARFISGGGELLLERVAAEKSGDGVWKWQPDSG